jgi:protein-disulfide isomerase
MTQPTAGSKDPDIVSSARALRRAARRARELGEQTGTPVYVIQGGQIVDLTKQKRVRRRVK